MKYLYSLPRIKYTFTTGEYTVVDIFTRVGFKTNFYANQSLYYEEDNDAVPQPDKLSFIKYENFDHYWMLLYVNKIYDINRDWPEIMENLSDLLVKYSKKSVYYLYEDGEILENDILYLNDTSYGVIESWNPFYKQLVLKESYNLPTTNFTDKVFKIRRINLDGSTTYLTNFCGTDSTNFSIFGHQYYLNAPHEIIGNSNSILNPFSGVTGSTVTEEIYIDTCESTDKTLFNNTVIYKVVNGQSVNNITVRDKEDELISNYVKKRKLKLIHPAIVAIIDTKTKQMLSNPLVTANTLYRTG